MPSIEISHNLDFGPGLPQDVLEVAEKQGEDPARVCAMIQEFKDMIYEKGDCTPHRMDNEFLIKFLRARYWKLDYAYKLICRYYEFREQNPTYHADVNPFSLLKLGECDIFSVPPYLEQTGRRMMIYKVRNWKPAKIPIDDVFRSTMVAMEIGSLEPRAQVMGAIGIFDLEGLTLSHAWQMSPSIAQKMISLIVTSMPIRTEAIHIVNQSLAFDVIYQMFKPILSERMKERLFIHGSNMKSLHKHIEPNYLPEKYGGVLPEYDYKEWIKNLANNDKVIGELKQLGYAISHE